MATSRPTRVSTIIAVTGTVVIVGLFAAAALGLGMSSWYKIGRLRIAPSTVALVLLPVPATAWIIVLWSRPLSSSVMRGVRILATLLLLLIAIVCAALTFFVLMVRPVSRIS